MSKVLWFLGKEIHSISDEKYWKLMRVNSKLKFCLQFSYIWQDQSGMWEFDRITTMYKNPLHHVPFWIQPKWTEGVLVFQTIRHLPEPNFDIFLACPALVSTRYYMTEHLLHLEHPSLINEVARTLQSSTTVRTDSWSFLWRFLPIITKQLLLRCH